MTREFQGSLSLADGIRVSHLAQVRTAPGSLLIEQRCVGAAPASLNMQDTCMLLQGVFCLQVMRRRLPSASQLCQMAHRQQAPPSAPPGIAERLAALTDGASSAVGPSLCSLVTAHTPTGGALTRQTLNVNTQTCHAAFHAQALA